jgi:HlyD family secretion protein
MKKITIWIAVGIAIVICLFVFLMPRKSGDMNYKTAKIERGDLTSAISATGTVNPVTSVDVGSQVSGIIQDVFVDYNSGVKKGQVVAQIDPTPFKAKLDQADANLTKARISVNDAKRTLDRNVELLSKNLIAQSDKDAAQTAYDNALAGLKQAQASYDLALSDIKNTTITSPISGTVVSKNINAGQTVAASFSAPTLFTIAKDLSEMQIEASIDEGDIGMIKNGQEVIFTVDAFPDENFNGRISQVRLSPEIVQRVVTYTVIIRVKNERLLLKPGMTANINIITDNKSGVLKVPNAALRFKPSEAVLQQIAKKEGNGVKTQTITETKSQTVKSAGRRMHNNTGFPESITKKAENLSTIWILNGQSLKMAKVKTGITDGISTEIESQEINEGGEVIIGLNGSSKTVTKQSSPFGMGGRH